MTLSLEARGLFDHEAPPMPPSSFTSIHHPLCYKHLPRDEQELTLPTVALPRTQLHEKEPVSVSETLN